MRIFNFFFFGISILITNKPVYETIAASKLPLGKLKGHETGRLCTIRGPGNELETYVLRETDQYNRT